MNKPDVAETHARKVCNGQCCPLHTPTGFTLYLLGLVIGIFATWPYKIIGLGILIALLIQAKGGLNVSASQTPKT
jgi:hypothetical protein